MSVVIFGKEYLPKRGTSGSGTTANGGHLSIHLVLADKCYNIDSWPFSDFEPLPID